MVEGTSVIQRGDNGGVEMRGCVHVGEQVWGEINAGCIIDAAANYSVGERIS